MEENFYDQIGRAYLDIVALHKEASESHLYLGGGFDNGGYFYLCLYDESIKNNYFYSQTMTVTPENAYLIFTAIGEVRGFIKGWAVATAVERKRAEEAAKPEIDFMTGEPVAAEPVVKEAE